MSNTKRTAAKPKAAAKAAQPATTPPISANESSGHFYHRRIRIHKLLHWRPPMIWSAHGFTPS